MKRNDDQASKHLASLVEISVENTLKHYSDFLTNNWQLSHGAANVAESAIAGCMVGGLKRQPAKWLWLKYLPSRL